MSNRFLEKHPDPHMEFCLCAVCFNGSNFVSHGFNSYKTDPLMKNLINRHHLKRLYDHQDGDHVSLTRHAEISAMKNAGFSDIDTIVVVRRTKDGNLACAKPCNICFSHIKESEIETVVYSTIDGFIMEKVH